MTAAEALRAAVPRLRGGGDRGCGARCAGASGPCAGSARRPADAASAGRDDRQPHKRASTSADRRARAAAAGGADHRAAAVLGAVVPGDARHAGPAPRDRDAGRRGADAAVSEGAGPWHRDRVHPSVLACRACRWRGGLASIISDAALGGGARAMHGRLGLGRRARSSQSDWFSQVDGRFRSDRVEPALHRRSTRWPDLAPEVRDWEPHLALTPGGDGLDAYRAIARGAGGHLMPAGG